jgi:glycosyltransferase involved in cell wall biosynthesis
MNKILCVGNWESDVGYAWWLMERLWEAIAKRHPGTIISFPKLNTVSQRLRDSGAQFVESHPTNIIDIVRKNGIKHVYFTDQPYYSTRYAMLRLAGVKSIIVHDHTPGERTVPRGLKRLLKTAIGRFSPITADAYIAVSDDVLKRFTDVACLPAHKCHVATNGIDIALDEPPVDIRAELGLPKGAIIVASSSRATQYKRVHDIIEAAARVKNAYFIHCGDGPDLPFFASEITRLGLGDKFFLLGRRADVAGILQSSDIAVHASEGEGASLSILEFMRAGLPIVLPNTPSVCRTVEDRVSGWLYEPRNIKQLASALSTLAAAPSTRQALGEAAKLHVKQYNIENTISSVLDVFSPLVTIGN